MAAGTLYGLGVGPGDPELLTVKAARVLREARVVAFFAKRGKRGNAQATAETYISQEAERLALEYPYTVEISPRHPEYVSAMRAFYDDSAARIAAKLDAGQDVVVLCEGDPMFYGSFMYLHDRLATRHRCRVIPGITSFAGCAASAAVALVSTDRVFSIVPATLPEEELENRLRSVDAAAIIKLGRHFKKVRRVLERLDRLSGALYFEHGTTEREVAMPLRDKTDDKSIYFALILLPGHDGGPYRHWDGGEFV
ncbi:MAG TPA: precorrin-2 C(20)-methyltransferase [Polyangiales bacterium]|nr:precorrin-2 C(20)-methyltransferase [Polyangiales bacterium]